MAWGAHRNGEYGLYLQRLDLDGQVLWSAPKTVSSTSNETFYGNPDLALGRNGDIIVVWDDERHGRNAFAQRLGSSGARMWPEEVRLNETGVWPVHPSLSMETQGSFITAWYDGRYGDDSIYAQRFDANGNVRWPQDLPLVSSESFYYPAGTAESNTVDDTPDNISQVSLTVDQTLNGGRVVYYLSNNGGRTWGRSYAWRTTHLHQHGQRPALESCPPRQRV